MTGGSELYLNLVVVIVVATLELVLWLRARKHAYEDDEDRFEALRPRLVVDIQQRAAHGHSPDWLRYQAELENSFEPRDERLRALSSAALALGLGGTIMALIVNIVFGPGLKEDPRSLIAGMGVALFGSLLGVANNLVITLRFLTLAQRRFHEASDTFRDELQEVSHKHPPTEAFTQTVKEELEGIRKALNQEFANAFSTAITGFPEVVAKLGSHMDRLAEVVEVQSSSVVGAVSNLETCTGLVAQASKRLQPAAVQLAAVSTDLAAMPERMSALLESHRAAWVESLRTEHQDRWEQLVTLHTKMERESKNREREMINSIAEVRGAVDRLPTLLAEEVNRVSNTFGSEFGNEARHQVNELSDKLAAQQRELLGRIENHEQEWRNNIGTVVRELLEQIGAVAENEIAAELRTAAQALSASSDRFSEIGEGFAESHRQWHETHEDSLRGWRDVSQHILEAAKALTLGDDQLKVAVDSLGRTTDHLERVAKVSSGFEAALREALKDVTDRHLEHVKPIHGEISSMIAELKAARGHYDGVLGQQSDFIARLIDQIVRERGMAEG